MVKDLSLKSRDGRAHLMLTKENGNKFSEVAGSITAECAAVVCCPCALLNLVVLALVKLPAGLSIKAWRKGRKKRKSMKGKEIDPVTSSQHELLTPKHNVNVLVMDHNRVSTEKIWENVVGKSHVGFWRNDFYMEVRP